MWYKHLKVLFKLFLRSLAVSDIANCILYFAVPQISTNDSVVIDEVNGKPPQIT